MNYQKHYELLIESRKNRILNENEYYEEHHIIPKCLGGSNEKDNLVKLTAREHFIAHQLLWLATKNLKLAAAFIAMRWHQKLRNLNSKQFEQIRKVIALRCSIMFKGRIFTEEHKRKISESQRKRMSDPKARTRVSESNRNRIITEETKQKMKESQRIRREKTPKKESYKKIGNYDENGKRIFTEEHKLALSKALKGREGLTPSQETRQKLSEAAKGKKRSEETKAKMREAWIKRKKDMS